MSSPTAKETVDGILVGDNDSSIVHYAISSMRGRRPTQEDTYVIETELRVLVCNAAKQVNDPLPGHGMFAAFDGHGTSFASEYAVQYFVSTFCSQASFAEYSKRFLDKPHQCNIATKNKKGKPSNKISQKKFNDKTSADDELNKLLEDAIKTTMVELDANMLRQMNSKKEDNMNHNSKSTDEEDQAANLYDISDAGTTAIIVIMTPNHIICANLGDSRAILQRRGAICKSNIPADTVVGLSTDHKPSNEIEEARICDAGGVVLGGKIEARLAVSRGLGDFDFKHMPSVLHAPATRVTSQCKDGPILSDAYIKPEDQMVSSMPEITTVRRNDNRDKFLVIACDGIWDVLSNEKCSHLVSTIFSEGEQRVSLVCEELLDQCYTRGSLDNMTAILIKFPSQEIGYGGGVMKRRKQRKRK